MTKRGAFEVAVKVVGVVCMVWAAQSLAGFLTAVLSDVYYGSPRLGECMALIAMIIPAAMMALLGCVLMFGAERLARRLVREDGEGPDFATMEMGPKAFTLGVKVVGLVVLVKGLCLLTEALILPLQGPEQFATSDSAYGRDIVALAQVALGVFFMFGGTWVARMAYRDGGAIKPPEQNGESNTATQA